MPSLWGKCSPLLRSSAASERSGPCAYFRFHRDPGRTRYSQQRLAELAQGVFFAPIDYRCIVRRVLRRLRPAVVVILETEIWPNLYRESKWAGASLLIVNGRISDRALPRYRRWKGFFRHALVWPDAIFTQSEEDARRFIVAGAPPGRVRAAGNLKYDFTPPSLGNRPGDRAVPGLRPT